MSFSLTSPKNPNSDLDRGPIYETPEQQRDGVLRSDATQRWTHAHRQSPARLHDPGDVVSQYLSQVMGAIQRMDLREPPETNDVRIIRPILENLVAELKPGDPIRFRQVGRKYVIDTTEFRNLTGFHYLQALLKDPGEYISATSLSPISKQVDFEPVAEHSVVHKSINRRYALEKKLKWIQRTSGLDNQSMCKSDEAFEVAEELLKIKKYLSGATHAGKIKHIHNDYDRNRQTVSKCIRLAISYLEKHPDTAHIGQHLRTNVKPGARCRYSGKWNWSFG